MEDIQKVAASLQEVWPLRGLSLRTREDKGKSRKISQKLEQSIVLEAKENDLKTVSNFYRYLIKEGIINPSSFTEVTLRNFLKANNIKFSLKPQNARKSFEMPHINMLWTADFMHGPYLTVGKKKQKTYLCVIIDDYSRLLVGTRFFFEKSSLAFADYIKRCSTYLWSAPKALLKIMERFSYQVI
jgi:putative transposase